MSFEPISYAMGKAAGGPSGKSGKYVMTEAQSLTTAQKIQALKNVDGVRIVTLSDGSITLAQVAEQIAEINSNGEHVFFDTAALAYPLYLCTIAINYENGAPVSYRLNDLVSGNIAMGAYDGSKTLTQILAGAVNAFYTIAVTAQTQDGVTVTGQTVTLRSGSESGPVYATAAYEGQPVSFSVPNGFEYYISITSTIPQHFNPTTARGIVNGADVSVTLTYSDFSNIRTFPDIQAALDNGEDMTDLVGCQVTTVRNNTTMLWDVVDYDSGDDCVTLQLHDTLSDNMQFEPAQALMWCENGLAAGSYKFKNGNTTYYLTLTQAIPADGQLVATDSAFQTYDSQNSTVYIETGTVNTTEIAGATDLGICGQGLLNHMDRVKYGSNNMGESALRQWLNSDATANTKLPRLTKFSRPASYNVPGFLSGWAAEDLACLATFNWPCSANTAYECPAELGGITTKGSIYTIADKISLASEKEIFGSYQWTDCGDEIFDLYVGAENADRIKYYNNSARSWWLRSPHGSYTNTERYVNTTGAVSNYNAVNTLAVAPACKIRRKSV